MRSRLGLGPPRLHPALAAALLLSVGGGCSEPSPGDGDADTDVDVDGDTDADIDAAGDADGDGDEDADEDRELEPVLVDVGHDRELRGVWIATVSNINWPSRQGLDAAEGQAELDGLVETAAGVGLNALFFQVRPEGDALYRSELEPWSRFLTGTQGGDPGYDPLEYLIEVAHPRGLEVHAWLNPYRAKSSRSSTAVSPHPSVVYPEYAYSYGTFLWMDPGAAPVRERVVAVVSDLVDRYDIDGIHFDDYFYPYPDGTPFPDDDTYGAYRAGGGTLGLADWRRDNVHQLVQQVSEAIAARRPEVRFGISPFGIYRPGTPPGITGLDQYAEIYADPVRWVEAGWVEYLAPQLYWPTTQTAQAYGTLIEWWAGQTSANGRTLFAGNYLSQLGSSSSWSLDEIRAQLDLTRAHRAGSALGNIYFHIGPFQEDRLGVATALRAEHYASPVLTPPLATVAGRVVEPPRVTVEGSRLLLAPRGAAPLRAFGLYRDDGAGGFALDRLLVGDSTEVTVEAGRWAVSAVDRAGVESRGVLVEVE